MMKKKKSLGLEIIKERSIMIGRIDQGSRNLSTAFSRSFESGPKLAFEKSFEDVVSKYKELRRQKKSLISLEKSDKV